MSFIHGYILGGLVLAGLPVLLHLIMRQKPRRLPFPAFRFLKQRHRINQRKLRLQHLLLLLLRVLVIASLCLALARPRVFSHRLSLGAGRPVSAVLVFDTSPSMEYAVAGQTRLDDAKQRARDLLEDMAAGSDVAVFETGDDTDESLQPLSQAFGRVESLRVRPANGPLNRTLERGLRLLAEAEQGEDAKPRVLYVFSDRTRACWEPSEVRKLAVPEGVQAVFVDVGVDNPRDLAIDKVEVDPPVAAPGERVQIRVTVRGTGADHENELSCQIDNDPDPDRLPERRPVQLAGGQTSDVITFERNAPPGEPNRPDTPYQVTVRLATRDALPFNNSRYATFLVRGKHKVLTVVGADTKGERPWAAWEDAIVRKHFRPEVRTLEEVEKKGGKLLNDYAVVCLFQVAEVPEGVWKALAQFVKGGGGLVLVPGGLEALPHRRGFNQQALAHGLLPARLVKVEAPPEGKYARWEKFKGDHPISAYFAKLLTTADVDFGHDELWPFARRFWRVDPVDKESLVVARYADRGNSPALVERPLGKGHVVQFTTPLDAGKDTPPEEPAWHNYWKDTSFGVVLVDRVLLYLAGESTRPQMNYPCGQVPVASLPAPPLPPYALEGPLLSASEKALNVPPEGSARLPVPQALVPGNFTVQDGNGSIVAGFSVNVRAEESDLTRVPAEEIESAVGQGSVVQVGRGLSLGEALQGKRPPPVELLPYLMGLLLLVLTVEGVLANKFYRKPAPVPGEGEEAAGNRG
jgi:hypothetical protein